IAANNSGTGEPVNTQISIYVVREGDTVGGIAQMFGVSVNTIIWANNITKASALRPGTTLVILPVSGITYTVKKGDTMKTIARNSNIDNASLAGFTEDVIRYNDLSSENDLVAGQTLILPRAEIKVSIPTRIVVKSGTNPAHDTNG